MKRAVKVSVLVLLGTSVIFSGFSACRKTRSRPAAGLIDAMVPCRMQDALVSFSRFHARRIVPLGSSGAGLFSGGADPERLRSLAVLMRKTAEVMSQFHSGTEDFDRLVTRRVRMFREMAVAWDKLAGDLDSKDTAAFKKDRMALISLRARDVTLRKHFAALYDACRLTSPF